MKIPNVALVIPNVVTSPTSGNFMNVLFFKNVSEYNKIYLKKKLFSKPINGKGDSLLPY